jgi:hypothetical protein
LNINGLDAAGALSGASFFSGDYSLAAEFYSFVALAVGCFRAETKADFFSSSVAPNGLKANEVWFF